MRFLFLCSCLTAAALAQQASITSLVGRVTDANGAAIPSASVTAANGATGESYSATTNVEGLYSLPSVRIGTYTITATAPGFGTLVHDNVLVQINQVVRTDFELPVGQVTEKVTVLAAPPPIATDDASISEVLDTKVVTEIPLNGRDVLRAATITPGVIAGFKSRTGSSSSGGEDFIGAGAREVQNSISLDGVSIMSNLISTTTLRPSVDAVEEFQIQTGTYSAEYGTMLGVHLNVITKSGGNDFHGTAFEFLRNADLDARNFFASPTAPKPPFHQNQFGGQLLGPVIIPKLYNGRNKTFFLIGYEGQRQTQSQSSLALVLPVPFRSGDLSAVTTPIKNPFDSFNPFPNNMIPASLLSPQAQKALAYMPLPNTSGTNNYLSQAGVGATNDQTLDRVDQNLGDKARLFFRMAYQNTTLLQGSSNPVNGINVPLFDRNYAIGYTHTISPHAVNDFRFGYEKNQYQSVNFYSSPSLAGAGTALGVPGFTTDQNNPGLIDFEITGYLSIGGQNMASSNWTRPSSTFEWTDVLNYTSGAHSIAAGAEFFRLSQGDLGNNSPRGLFTFTGQITGNAPADFLLGLPLQATTPAPTTLMVQTRQWRTILCFRQVERDAETDTHSRPSLRTADRGGVAKRDGQYSQPGPDCLDSRQHAAFDSPAYCAADGFAAQRICAPFRLCLPVDEGLGGAWRLRPLLQREPVEHVYDRWQSAVRLHNDLYVSTRQPDYHPEQSNRGRRRGSCRQRPT